MKYEQTPDQKSGVPREQGDTKENSGLIEQERKKAMDRLSGHSFKTEKGSVYTYGGEGQTSRFKASTGEQHEAQDITVFVDLNDNQSRVFLDAIHSENPDLKKKVYVVERQIDQQPKIIRKVEDVTDPNNLYLAIIENGKMTGVKKATLKPTKGYSVFDTRHFQKGEGWKTERHLGHEVTEIN